MPDSQSFWVFPFGNVDKESRRELRSLIDRARRRARRLIGEDLINISALPIELRVIIIVVSAQGVLDNGGYQFFFESDWPGRPDYERFAQAYDAIGCHQAASNLRRVVRTFPFPDPHLDKEARNAFIAANLDKETGSVHGWENDLCGEPTVWPNLAAYCRRHRHVL
jgi:hypothetical protein